MRSFPFVIAAGILLGAAASQAGDLPQAAADDLYYRSALYNYHLERYPSAHNHLFVGERLEPVDGDHSYRQTLLARLYVDTHQYERAQNTFDNLTLDEIPAVLRKEVYYALAQLYLVEGRCQEVLTVLEQAGSFTGEQDAHVRYMRASCMMNDELNVTSLARAESVLRSGGGPRSTGHIWYAYGYYNIAVAAANIGKLEEADRLYLEALRYTGSESEGRALAEKIRLSRGNVNYAMNRFDFAMRAYQQLPLNSIWTDEALLGYGWTAFRNYQSDIALEAWRQLINLPYRSMSVYQGYLAIPYALERADARFQALEAYQSAISQYESVTQEIDAFAAQLTLEQIRDHAVHYANRRGRLMEPLHPLLAGTYVQEDFRHLVERIGSVSSYKQQLQDQRGLLDMFRENQRVFEVQAPDRQQWREQQQRQTQADLQRLSVGLDDLLESVMRKEMAREDANPQVRSDYQRYAALRARFEQLPEGREKQRLEARLQQLRGVLFFFLVEREIPVSDMQAIRQIINRYQTLAVRFNEYQALTEQTFRPVVSGDQIDALQQRIDQTMEQADDVLLAMQAELKDKTLLALQEQRDLIQQYKTQAYIAATNLKEDFYQRGGGRLWQ